MLKRMNKTSRRADYLKAIPLMNAVGISTHANFIVGFPGETYETVQETIDLIEETKPDSFRAQLWYCDPVTPIWERKAEYGLTGHGFYWSHTTMNSKIAADLVDKVFLSVQSSTWVPLYGFSDWSRFYLREKGMTPEQVRTFQTCFNAIVKEKLTYPNKGTVDPQLIENLKRSSQFDRPARPDMASIQVLSGSSYVTAEKFWVSEFGDGVPSSNIALMRNGSGEVAQAQAAPFCLVEGNVAAADLWSEDREALPITILAAYSVLLSRLNGQEETVIVSAVHEKNQAYTLPLRLYPAWDTSFGTFVQAVQQKLQRALAHQYQAFHFLTNPLRMLEHGRSCPNFDVGYMYCESQELTNSINVQDILPHYPTASQKLELILKATKREGDINLQLFYRENQFNPHIIENLPSYLKTILQEVSQNPQITLGDILLTDEKQAAYSMIESDAADIFKF